MLKILSLGLYFLLLSSHTASANPFALKLSAQTVFTNFSDSEKERMQLVLKKLLKVINSDQFKEKVLSHKYNGDRTFVDNNGMSNLEVYQHLISGAEDLLDDVDHQMDLNLNMYYSLSSTIGYTYPNTLKIWINRRFFQGFKPSQIAANLIHEYMHKLGFGHDYNYTERRPFSVPYAFGKIVRKIMAQVEFEIPSTPTIPIYIPGDFNTPNNGRLTPIALGTQLKASEESQDMFSQHSQTTLPDHYMGPCTDHPNDSQ